jgi:hypothetical protein
MSHRLLVTITMRLNKRRITNLLHNNVKAYVLLITHKSNPSAVNVPRKY